MKCVVNRSPSMCWFCSGPSIPSPIEIGNVTTSSMLLSWTAAVGAWYYRVIAADDDEDVVSNTIINVARVLVTQLQPGTRYTLTVTAYDSDQHRGNTARAHVVTGNISKVNADDLMLQYIVYCRLYQAFYLHYYANNSRFCGKSSVKPIAKVMENGKIRPHVAPILLQTSIKFGYVTAS